MPAVPPPLVYPAHFETRLVSKNSGIRWRDKWVAVSTTCAGLYVGMEEIDHGLWDVYLGPVKLGRLFEKTLRIEAHLGRLKRINVSPMSTSLQKRCLSAKFSGPPPSEDVLQ
jgi:hypothetical protein